MSRMTTWAMAVAVVPGFLGLSGPNFGLQPAQPTPPTPPTPPAAPAVAGAPDERVVVPWSDPSRPGVVRVNLINGAIVVKGYDGKEVIVETRGEDRSRRRNRSRSSESDDGLKRIANVSSGVTIEEDANELRIGAQMGHEDLQLTVQVPRRTSLKLSGVNDGSITVENVDGEVEASHVNGPVTIINVSGSVVAHSLNDDLKVTMSKVSGKAMSFSSMNGDIDVTLPADIKANVRLETVQGEILTDFDLVMQPSQVTKTVAPSRKGGGSRIKLERAMVGTINGGGPELNFKNFNGDIRIRKAK